MLLVEGATYALNPDPPFIPPTGNDLSLQQGAVYRMRFEEFFDAALRGDVDRMFLSGGQIDPYGNTNVTAIGAIDRPKVKLGGGGGGCNLAATIGHLSLWTTRHRSGRTLVSNATSSRTWAIAPPRALPPSWGSPVLGPEWLITELGVFDYDDDGHARLRQVFPDVSLEVRSRPRPVSKSGSPRTCGRYRCRVWRSSPPFGLSTHSGCGARSSHRRSWAAPFTRAENPGCAC